MSRPIGKTLLYCLYGLILVPWFVTDCVVKQISRKNGRPKEQNSGQL
jgi:hypothetical protein